VTRRLVLLGLVAATQLTTGCFPCVRQRIAWRWHNCHAPACAPACGPVCGATPAFRIPTPVAGLPIGAPGCSTCSSGFDAGPVAFAGPAFGPAVMGAPPVIGNPMPLGAPRVEIPAPMPSGAPKQ
jgi:hypothetical protein